MGAGSRNSRGQMVGAAAGNIPLIVPNCACLQGRIRLVSGEFCIDIWRSSWYSSFMLRFVVVLVLIVCIHPLACADIYKYVTNDGVIVFTDVPSEADTVVLRTRTAKKEARPVSGKGRYQENFRRFYPIVKLKAEEYGLDPELVKALITVESSWHPSAVSSKGAMGLMQLMPRTAQSLSVGNPFDPQENVTGGVKYLRMLIDYFGGDLRKALAAYYAGPTRVVKTAYFPEGSDTRAYVDKVLRLYGGEQKFQYRPIESRPVDEPVYRMVMEDGTLLFTNTLPVSGVSYR